MGKLKRFLNLAYAKLFLINDSPHKIALGFALGVFTGFMPGIGPLTSLFLAFLFRVNRAAALLGSLITNTWISLVTFLLSIKIGSAIMNVDWHAAYDQCLALVKDFHWAGLCKLSASDVVLPLALGYLVISLSAGLSAYILILAAISLKKWKQRRS